MRGNHICQRAFACLVALYLLLHATNLTWMAIYFWFFFIWLGAILSEVRQQELHITEWGRVIRFKGQRSKVKGKKVIVNW